MKKNYNQPIVETQILVNSGQALCTSTQFGGDTSTIPGEDPIIGG